MLDRLRRFRERFPVQAIVIEVFAIVLGVLFALYVKDWRDEREQAALAQHALKSFEQEICFNQHRIREVLPYHEAMRDTFQYVFEKRTLQTFMHLYDQVGFRGYRTRSPLNAAMETARSTGAIGLLDYEMTQALVRTYSVQEELDEVGEQLLSPLAHPLGLDPGNLYNVINAGILGLTDVVIREKMLLQNYPRVLQMLAERTGSIPQSDTINVDSLCQSPSFR